MFARPTDLTPETGTESKTGFEHSTPFSDGRSSATHRERFVHGFDASKSATTDSRPTSASAPVETVATLAMHERLASMSLSGGAISSLGFPIQTSHLPRKPGPNVS